MTPSSNPHPNRSLLRRIWRIAFLTQGIVAATAWWLLPGGFPPYHVKFWTNQVLVPGLALAMAVACYADVREKRDWLSALALGTSSAWLAGGLAAAVLFPASLLGRGLAVAVVGALGLVASVRFQVDPEPRIAASWHLACGFLAAGLAGVVVWGQRAGEPGTHPKGHEPLVLGNQIADTPWRWEDAQLGSGSIDLHSARVDLKQGNLRVGIEPLLTFESRSVDRGWTLFAAPADRIGPKRSLGSFQHRPDWARAEYGAAEPARFDVQAQPEVDTFVITAQVELPRAVYSHLNSYATVFLSGHERIELEFSPCPGQWIEPVPHGYPFGLPLRLGTMYRDGLFRVVQATSAEKGPFQTLAEGRLTPGDPISIKIRDAGRPRVEFVFEDWSSQASADVSPTAGWGLPQNEIMFARHTDDPSSAVFIGLTLASTSTGRGFESVGHAAGVYRNRVRVVWLKN